MFLITYPQQLEPPTSTSMQQMSGLEGPSPIIDHLGLRTVTAQRMYAANIAGVDELRGLSVSDEDAKEAGIQELTVLQWVYSDLTPRGWEMEQLHMKNMMIPFLRREIEENRMTITEGAHFQWMLKFISQSQNLMGNMDVPLTLRDTVNWLHRHHTQQPEHPLITLATQDADTQEADRRRLYTKRWFFVLVKILQFAGLDRMYM